MLSLRAAAARTRAITAPPSLAVSFRRPVSVLHFPLSLPSHLPLILAPQRSLFPSSLHTPLTLLLDQPDRNKRHPSLIDSAPGWNEDLATPSEAFVKADRETTTFDDLQQKTVDYVQLHHHDLDVEQTHATYAREEIAGPLGNARVGEFEGVVGKDDLGPDDAHVESDGRVVTRRVVHEKTVRQGPV
ncbi:hypothetical protein HD554DRAFT_2083109 [Boletus coccyginus]|nr:hypothetical protein HD554DRAFT_2083109 [Boletus coccyginus]